MTTQDFIQKWNGRGIDFDGAFRNQCMDLYRQYVKEVLRLPQSPPVTGAVNVWDTYLKDYFTRISNTPSGVPQNGDIVIWGKGLGKYGHIAVFVEGDTKSFTSFDQNFPVGSLCHLQEHTYKSVLGWLHPKKQEEAEEVNNNMTVEEKTVIGLLADFRESDKTLKKGNLEGATRAAIGAYHDVSQIYKPAVESAEANCEKRVQVALDRANDSNNRAIQEIEAKWQEKIKSAKSGGDSLVERMTSRKWLLTLLGVSVPLANKYLGLELSVEEVMIILSPILSFIVVEGVKDFKKA